MCQSTKTKDIDEMNTIEGVELYKPLYDLYSQIFYATNTHRLACLGYFEEQFFEDEVTKTFNYAEITDTWKLELKERYNKHLELYERILRNDQTLEYTTNPTQIDEDCQEGRQCTLWD